MDINNVINDNSKSEQKLWKYLDFAKFMSMLNFNKMYYTRLDKLEDNFEGRAPEIIAQYLYKSDWNEIKNEYEIRRKQRFINCWTSFKGEESYAMWNIFSKEYGLAIETNITTLKEQLPKEAKIAKVEYINFKKSNNMDVNKLTKITEGFSAVKSIEYSYEKEVRVILPYKTEKKVISSDVDIEKLINRVIISPYENEWFYNLIVDIVKKKYAYQNIEIIKSDINVIS